VQLLPRPRGRHHKDLPVIVRHVAARLLVAAALAGAGGPALAGRPLQTEDADILDRGECELESFWARNETQRINRTVWSAAIERTGIGRYDLMAEVFGDDRSAPWWKTGLRYPAIASLLFVDVSYGAQLRGGRPKRLTAGLKYTF
jgi:hypothetical protein